MSRSPDAPPAPFEGPLFLIGLPRSGTKLLRDLLNRHPRVAIPVVETEFLPYLLAHSDRWPDLSRRADFDALHRAVRDTPYFRLMAGGGWRVDPERWFRACREPTVAGAFEALIRTQLGVEPGSGVLWGDKSPSHLTHARTLAEHFPRARFVHIVRDARDQALSAHRAWGTSLLRAAQRWRDGVRAVAADAPALGARFHQLRYEDLLEDPEREVRAVAAFLDLPYRSEMTRLERSMERDGDAEGWTAIKRDNAGKYRAGLAPRTCRRIERIAGAELRLHGYAVPDDRPPLSLPAAVLVALQLWDGLRFLRVSARDVGARRALGYAWTRFATSGNRFPRGGRGASLRG